MMMSFPIILILGLGIFNSFTNSRESVKTFDEAFAAILNDDSTSDDDFINFLTLLYGYDYDDSDEDDEYDEYDEESSEETDKPVPLPSGSSWLASLNLSRPEKPIDFRPNPGVSLGLSQKANYSEEQQGEEQSPSIPLSAQETEESQTEQQASSIFANSKPLPTFPPNGTATIPFDFNNPTNPLILSTPDDAVDDTDGEGVLVGE